MGRDVHTWAFEPTHKLGQTARCLVVAKQTSLIPFGQFSLGRSTAHLASGLAREPQLGHNSRERVSGRRDSVVDSDAHV